MTLVKTDPDARFVVTQAIGPVSIATDTNTESSAIDLANYPGWKVLLIASTGTRTDGSFTASLREDDASGGSYTAMTPVSGSLTAIAGANSARKASFVPSKRYLKVRIASTGTTSGALLSAVVVLIPPGS